MSQDVTQAAQETVKSLMQEHREYLSALNTEVAYAQKAYLMAIEHVRKLYDAPEAEWMLSNINRGFERVVKNG